MQALVAENVEISSKLRVMDESLKKLEKDQDCLEAEYAFQMDESAEELNKIKQDTEIKVRILAWQRTAPVEGNKSEMSDG